MINNKLTFPKKEKLCSNKQIEELFAKGKSFIVYPVRIVYIIRDENDMGKQVASVLISVSKKRFKRANKRNRVKRLIREAYRLNKLGLQETLVLRNKSVDIAFLYLKNTLPEYAEMEESMTKAIKLLSERVGEVGE
jgi:ribonuclease P protein component